MLKLLVIVRPFDSLLGGTIRYVHRHALMTYTGVEKHGLTHLYPIREIQG